MNPVNHYWLLFLGSFSSVFLASFYAVTEWLTLQLPEVSLKQLFHFWFTVTSVRQFLCCFYSDEEVMEVVIRVYYSTWFPLTSEANEEADIWNPLVLNWCTFYLLWASDLQLWLLLQVYQASYIYFSVSGCLILLACFVIKANKSRPRVHAVLQYSRVTTTQAWEMYFWISLLLEDTPISLHIYFPHI